ncbi:tetratricopeptide repeat protein [Argonema galeatum]|uniref:tetratricopeptide repeat protein n=1 Tax=Argonema galeatum TaxID=2942762 RepID=UPI0020130737|nr:tetratricopeptide repeat protein [Argonema galeatum A003/A1]
MGRKEEVEVLQKWLANPNINTIGIQGLGGIGKSSLAAYLYKNSGFAAKSWADVSQKPDFAAFAEKTIPALGGSITQTGDTTQLINDLLKCLRQQRCLLVIDNLETLLNEAREFPDSAYQQFFRRWLRQGETSTLLLTTQEQPHLLQAKANWYLLAGMTPSDGVQLLQKLEIQGTVEELAAFAAIVDGHPLTLQLVAGFLRQYCHSRLSGVAELELQQFDLVYRQAEGLHRDKEDARLEWILQQHLQRLSEEQQNFLVNLSVYRLPFDFRAAGRMLGDPPNPPCEGGLREGGDPPNPPSQGGLRENGDPRFEGGLKEIRNPPCEGGLREIRNPPCEGGLGGISLAIVKALRELSNRSLLLETEVKDYYKFQPLVQEYLQKQGTDLSAAHEKAIDYYKSQVRPQPWETLKDVRAYLEIFYHLCQLQRYGEAFYTIRDDNDVNNFLDLRGYYATQVSLYEQLVQAWQPNESEKVTFAAAINNLGLAYNAVSKYQQAIELFDRLLVIAVDSGDRKNQANALGNLGFAYNNLGQYNEAIKYLEQALQIDRKTGDIGGTAKSLNHLGNAYDNLGEYQQAIHYYQQCLNIAMEIRDRREEANALGNLGLVYKNLGQYQQAIEFIEKAIEIDEETGYQFGKYQSIRVLGSIYIELKIYTIAIIKYQQCLEIEREIGDRRGEGSSLDALGNAYDSLGQYQEAIGFYQQRLEIAREIGDRRGEGGSLNNLGNAYYYLGQYQEAIRFYQQWLEIAKEIGDRRGESGSLNNLGNAYYYLGQYQEAIRFYQQWLEIAREIGDKRGKANSFLILSASSNKIGRVKEGYAAAYQAIQILKELKLPLEAMPYPNWMKLIAKFAQRGKWQLALCFILGLFAFPFGLVWIVGLMLWRVVSAKFRRRG